MVMAFDFHMVDVFETLQWYRVSQKKRSLRFLYPWSQGPNDVSGDNTIVNSVGKGCWGNVG